MNDDSSPQREAWRLFLRAHARVLARLEEQLEAATGLPLSWYDVLAHLSLAPQGRLRLQDLGRSLVISKSGLTRRIDRMVEAGLVTRCGCPQDRRSTYAVLTSLGKEALDAARPVHLAGVRDYFVDRVTADQAESMMVAFQNLVDGAN